MSKYNLIDIFEGMSDDEISRAEEADRLEAHPEKETIKKIQSLMAKEKSLQSKQRMSEGVVKNIMQALRDDAKATDAEIKQYMTSLLDAGDVFDEVDDYVEDFKEFISNKSLDEKATSHIKEVRIDDEVAERIEGLTNQELKRKFLFAFEDLYSDLIEEDPFHAEDVINHLNNEMHKHLSSFQNTGDKFAGIEEAKPGYNEDGTPKSNDEMGDDEREDFYNDLDSVDEASSPKVDFIRTLKVDANGTKLEIKSYLESLKRSGDKFDNIDDYVEDFKNYVADKALQEHFKRFI